MAAASHGRRSGRPRVEIKDIDIDDITFSSDEEETSKGRSAPSAASLLAAFKTASRAKSPPAVSVSPPPKSSVPDKLVDFDDDEDNAEIDYGDDPFETVDSEPGTLITEEAKPTAIEILEPPTRTLSRSKSFLESLAEMKSHQASSTAPAGTEHPGGDDATRPAPTPTIPETNPEPARIPGALLKSPAAATATRAVHGGTDEPKVNMETKQLKHPPLQALKGLKDKVRSRKGSRARDSCDGVTRQVGHPQDAVAQTQQERVNELEREKFLLEAKLKELSVSANGTFRDRFAMLSPDASSPVIEARHLDAIREEMRTMENIISALNEENAKLCASLRGEQIAMKGTTQQMLSRNKALKSELDAAKSEIQELRGSKFVTADEAALDEIRRLKQALVQVRHESEGKIKELQYQLEKQRKVQHELEYKLDNYDPISPRKHHEGDIELRMKIQQMSESHAKEVNELKEKLAWYIKNQTVIDEVENESRAKSETIRNLQQRIEVLQNQSAQNRSKPKPAPAPSSAKYEKKIRELEAQIAGLQSRHGPVNALVKSIKPSASQVEALKKQVTDLQAELVAKDDEYLSRIRSLRLEYDKMRMQYDERIAELTADKRDRDRPNSRIQELEAQIEEMRETYRRKGAVVIQQPSRPGGDKAISRSTRSNADDEGESPMLRSQLNEAMQTITALRSKLEAADKEMQNYRQHIRTLESQPLATGGRAATDKDYDTVIEAMSQAHSSQLEELRRQIETLTVNATKSLDTTASSHLIASLQSQLEIANREKQSLRESLIETQYELSRLRSMPSHVQLSVLEAKLAEIEARHAQREQVLHSAMQTLQEQQAAQSSQSSQKYEAIIKEKNAQILQFKTELDAMLATLAELQRSE
ncbi:unnamed protein product (mitochondrion) [Plasmodiophora brassicae]|uniref:Centrosomal protein of 162 kDa n=1 Tax=Plasmodiophora brassicae TaxID=37360 RepID=A0A3P3YIM8_PLABS|nr:unnamed protein product [Plasmodiophora brassicae]